MKIAVLIGGILYGKQKALLDGIAACIKEMGEQVFVFTCNSGQYQTNEHFDGEFQIYDLPQYTEYDGIIFVPDTIQNTVVVKKIEQEVRKAGVPVISIDTKLQGIPCYEVDNQKAMYYMTKHIVERHTAFPVVYLSGPDENKESICRLDGFCQYMDEKGFLLNKDYEIYHGNFWKDSGRNMVNEYFERHKTCPKAVICANDHMSCGVMDALKEKGYHVPQDVLVTGFDNTVEAAHFLPRLTSIEKPLYEMGYKACRKLLTDASHITDIKFDVTYYYSESCGCQENDVPDSREFGLHMLKEKSDSVRQVEQINNMLADMDEVENLGDFNERMKQFVMELKFPYFALCLCEDNKLIGDLEFEGNKYIVRADEESKYTDILHASILHRKGEFLDAQDIQKGKLLPENFLQQGEGCICVIVPLHFRRHCMGYCVLGNSLFPTETVQFYTWVMNLGTALEHIRKQSLMQQMLLRLNKMSNYDMMTGVYNRIGFYAKAEKIIKECERQEKDMCLFFLDIDGLKYVNDNYGHNEGDYYIRSVAQVCQDVIGSYGIVMRYGGDEFVMLLSASQEVCHNMEKCIHEKVRHIKERDKKLYPMGVSIGYYWMEQGKEIRLDFILDMADKEMYVKKRRTKLDNSS